MKLDELEHIGDAVTVPCQVWIHFGWDGAGSGNRTQQDIQQKNVGDSLCALKGADSLGCSRFLFSGSQAEYGIRDSLMKETDCCHPVSEYGKAKAEFYRQAMSYMRERQNSHPMEYVHARIFSVYGPGDHPWSLAETCKKTFLSGGHMELGECTQQWNFLHRDDCIRALYLLATVPESIGFPAKSIEENGIYNVAGLGERDQASSGICRRDVPPVRTKRYVSVWKTASQCRRPGEFDSIHQETAGSYGICAGARLSTGISGFNRLETDMNTDKDGKSLPGL